VKEMAASIRIGRGGGGGGRKRLPAQVAHQDLETQPTLPPERALLPIEAEEDTPQPVSQT
jgi:hypothetical protein